jgi:hypothetical protein
VSHGVAATQGRLAPALEQMPTADALAQSELSLSAVTMLASAREASPESFDRS